MHASHSQASTPGLVPTRSSLAVNQTLAGGDGDGLELGMSAELVQYVLDMTPNGVDAQVELGGNVSVGQTRCHKVEHLQFPGRQGGSRLARAVEMRLHRPDVRRLGVVRTRMVTEGRSDVLAIEMVEDGVETFVEIVRKDSMS